MPTLTRFIVILVVIAACIYGVMLALVTLVRPVTSEVTIRIPPAKMLQQSADNSRFDGVSAASSNTESENAE